MSHKNKKIHKMNLDNIVVLKKPENEERVELVSGNKISKNDDVILWQAPEYEYNPKDVSWHWISVIIAVVLITIALWQKNFLFAIFIVIAEIIVLYFSNTFPRIWNFKIDESGLTIGENRYLFSDMQSFDIHEVGEDYKELVFKLRSKFKTVLRVFIHKDDEEKIKEKLLEFLPQEDLQVSLADLLERFIRF
ncbi:hypothetical protein COV23_00910 [Candidatus Wolfebacteria bacterium CG10_big_fil_rev_8_21_14_0_10_31_9]|uniref:DUF5673 domain-containing protein n=1 Tax=Candidatus Wolfebacteria bacterium CG10_big_fil_rev_8_21_14_0_10_31_9 TaxID=1975070 RepID=A0A2H0RCT6_9BACT|nr:MAG: hypothetical protein COV23_00910 [Candidatus Wolfebacteria bacterium CG10_big_fil_rev_8_21_14_0_10_31_9]